MNLLILIKEFADLKIIFFKSENKIYFIVNENKDFIFILN